MRGISDTSKVASHLLIAIDPGKRVCGVSIWGCSPRGSELLHACSIRPRGPLSNLPREVDLLWGEFAEGFSDAPPQFIFEVPRYYMKKRATFRGVDALFDVLDAFKKAGIPVKNYVYPSQWKGNLPKDIHQRRIKKSLSRKELLAVDAKGTHDMWDAIGIGLFAVRRTSRAGVPIN